MSDQLNKNKINECTSKKLVSKLTVEYNCYPTFRKDVETNTWYCGSPRSTYDVERIMFGIIYEITYGEGVNSNDNPVENFRSKFLKEMNNIRERTETNWCYYLTDENLNEWCSKAVEIFNGL